MPANSTTKATIDDEVLELAARAAAELLEHGGRVLDVDLVVSADDGPVLVVVVDDDIVDEFHRLVASPDRTPARDLLEDVDNEAALLEDEVPDQTATEVALSLLGVDLDAWWTGELALVLGSEFWTEPEQLRAMPPAVQASVDTRLSFHYPSGQFTEPVG